MTKAKRPKPPKPSQRERLLSAEIKQMLQLARDAEAVGIFGAAVQARKQVTELRDTLARLRGERLADATLDPLERAARMRRLAAENKSYVAAAKFQKIEADLLIARQAEENQRGDELEDLTDDELLEVIEGVIESLPDILVQRIRDAALRRLGERP